MSQTELPLYPKISSIYNKILQLAIAIVLIIVVLDIWLDSEHKYQQTLQQHFAFTSRQYVEQIALTIATLKNAKRQDELQQYVAELQQQTLVRDVHLYDDSGQEILASPQASSINDLYGISANKLNQSDRYIPFVTELPGDGFQGYVRVTIVKAPLFDALTQQNHEQQQLMRIMLLFAGLVGFLLTRGLSRFSRQGYRLAAAAKAQDAVSG